MRSIRAFVRRRPRPPLRATSVTHDKPESGLNPIWRDHKNKNQHIKTYKVKVSGSGLPTQLRHVEPCVEWHSSQDCVMSHHFSQAHRPGILEWIHSRTWYALHYRNYNQLHCIASNRIACVHASGNAERSAGEAGTQCSTILEWIDSRTRHAKQDWACSARGRRRRTLSRRRSPLGSACAPPFAPASRGVTEWLGLIYCGLPSALGSLSCASVERRCRMRSILFIVGFQARWDPPVGGFRFRCFVFRHFRYLNFGAWQVGAFVLFRRALYCLRSSARSSSLNFFGGGAPASDAAAGNTAGARAAACVRS